MTSHKAIHFKSLIVDMSTNTKVGENSLFAVTGLAQVTVNSQTRTITHIFLDPDQGITGDDLGIRVNSLLRKDAQSRA